MSDINDRKAEANKALAESTAFVLITVDKDHKQDIINFTSPKETAELFTGLGLASNDILRYIRRSGMVTDVCRFKEE